MGIFEQNHEIEKESYDKFIVITIKSICVRIRNIIKLKIASLIPRN